MNRKSKLCGWRREKKRISIYDLKNIEFPECYQECAFAKMNGASECQDECRWKFDKHGNPIKKESQ